MKQETVKPLSHKQKAALCRLAGMAWNVCGKAMGFGDVTEFRHASVFDVTGKEGLTFCDQLDYIPITNYFHKMLGWPPREDRTPKTAIARALWVLRDALQRWEFTEGYAASIMRARLGAQCSGVFEAERLPLSHLAAKLGAEGTRQVTYTVINRGREKHRMALEAGAQESPRGLEGGLHDSKAVAPQGRRRDGACLREPHHSPSTLPPGGLAAHFGAVLAGGMQQRGKSRARKEVAHA